MKSLMMPLVLLLVGAFLGVQPVNAQQQVEPRPVEPAPDPLEGCWSTEGTQTGTGTACVCVTKVGNNVLTYPSSSGDSGTIAKVTGGYAFTSSQRGGGGVIQPNGDGTYAWQNNETGAGGTMSPGCE